MNILRGVAMAMLVLAAQAMALDKVPAVMVSTSTNTYNVLTGKTAQADFDFIDDWLVAESNRLNAVSNLAQAAYNLAGTNGGGSGDLRTYTYVNTGTIVNVDTAIIGSNYFIAGVQMIGRLHVGMSVTGAMFSAGTTITAVDYETSTRKVTISLVCAGNASYQPASFYGSGTYTHVVPTNWTRCKITVTGGGGSGGADKDDTDAGSGGAAGGTSIGYWPVAVGAPLVPGSSYTITVGAGGAGVTNDASGNAGSTSSIGSLQSATGGAGGSATGGGYSSGGLGSGGQINLKGGYGLWGEEPDAVGGNDPQDGGAGGASYWGSGGEGETGGNTGDANAINPGSGGGGADDDALSGRGQFGTVVIEYF